MSFDWLAPHYDWLEAGLAGQRLQCARTAQLAALAGRRRILSVGEGHGRFAAACLARYPGAELTCVEASPRMIARAQRRLGHAAHRVAWHCGDALAWATGAAWRIAPTGVSKGAEKPFDRRLRAAAAPPPLPFDAIVTCFFLDCLPPDALAAIIRALSSCAADDAVWLLADFTLPARGPARWRAQAVHFLMYSFFRAATRLPARRLTKPDAGLQAEGFTLVARHSFDWGLIHSDAWERRPGI